MCPAQEPTISSVDIKDKLKMTFDELAGRPIDKNLLNIVKESVVVTLMIKDVKGRKMCGIGLMVWL